jgi:homocysteine S-methyltransferase
MLHDGSEYRGDFNRSERELALFHEKRARILLDAGADVLACETVPQLTEAVAFGGAMSAIGEKVAWLCLTSLDGVHTPRGERLSDCASALDGFSGLCAIGVNCIDSALVATALRSLRDGTDKPLLAYPNRGGRWDPVAKQWVGGHDTDAIAIHAAQWIASGAKAIGGCCRTTPDDIASLAVACGRKLGAA